MPSGLIFTIILVIWAIVLVPRMIGMYDLHSTERSTRRFRHAMSSLGGVPRSKRPADVLMVRRAAPARTSTVGVLLDPAVDLHLDHGVDPFLTESYGGERERERRRVKRVKAARMAAMRRRRVMVALVGLMLVVGALAGAGILALWLVAVPAGLLAAMLAVSRRYARAQAQWRAELTARAEARRAASLAAYDVLPDAPVVAARRRTLEPTQARLAEQYRALSATYRDAEDQLGLDDYAAGTATAAAGRLLRRLRAANE